MPLAQARAKNLPVILCQYRTCNRPAVVLDHRWPYWWDENRCARHVGF
jgi:hypothetical protein